MTFDLDLDLDLGLTITISFQGNCSPLNGKDERRIKIEKFSGEIIETEFIRTQKELLTRLSQPFTSFTRMSFDL